MSYDAGLGVISAPIDNLTIANTAAALTAARRTGDAAAIADAQQQLIVAQNIADAQRAAAEAAKNVPVMTAPWLARWNAAPDLLSKYQVAIAFLNQPHMSINGTLLPPDNWPSNPKTSDGIIHIDVNPLSGRFNIWIETPGLIQQIGGVIETVAPAAGALIPGAGILLGAAIAAGGSTAGQLLATGSVNPLKTVISGAIGAAGQALNVGEQLFGSGIPPAPTDVIAGVDPATGVVTIPDVGIGGAVDVGGSGLGTLVQTPLEILPGTTAPLPLAGGFSATLPASATVATAAGGVTASSLAAGAAAAAGALKKVLPGLFGSHPPMTTGAYQQPTQAGFLGGNLWPLLLFGVVAVVATRKGKRT